MRRPTWGTTAAAALALALAVALGGCPSDDPGKDGSIHYLDGHLPEAGYCKHPALSVCEPPPNMYSAKLWYCPCVPQNICNGGNEIAACNPSTNDCRYFADSCYPLGYSACDVNASDRVLFLCGTCFFIEAGIRGPTDPLPKVCDQMQLDGGVTQKDTAAVKDTGAAKDTGAVKDASTLH